MALRTPVNSPLRKAVGKDDLAVVAFANGPIHPGLVLDRYLPWNFTPAPQRFDSEQKGPWMKQFVDKANAALAAGDAPWRTWSKRLADLFPDGPGVRSFVVRPRWRWVVGLGNQSVLETGILLHHTYGVPYVPGSGLKGLTQALVEVENPTGLDQAEKDRIFGKQSADADQAEVGRAEESHAAGEVVFLGAVPVDGKDVPRLVVDVMTPHFPKYYQGSRPEPLEVEDPEPIPFLVAAGGAYRVTLAARRAGANEDEKKRIARAVEQAADVCRMALEDMGIGGKTAKGYGYFVK